MTTLSRASDFPELTRADWLKRVDAALKGAHFEDRLITTTPDGIRLEPLYGQVHGPRAARPEQTPWTLSQRVDHPDPAKANALALEDLSNGATGLVIVARNARSSRGFGVDPAALSRILQGVHLHAVALRIEGDGSRQLADIIASQPIDPERLHVSFDLDDPVLITELVRRGFSGPFMEADGRSWHERGATEAQELGAALADAIAKLRHLEGLNDVHLVKAVGVTLAATQDMFMTLAKFRAMRLMWKRVLQIAGLPDAPLRLHAETSWRMTAELDPHTNILRSTAAVFGAGLGGASSISVLPHSMRQGLPNGFARRVSRNVQNILLEESNLWRVADSASGSGYVESLTSSLSEKAWAIFQNAEAGKWPSPAPETQIARPVIGTTNYRLAEEHAADVESLS